MSRVYLLQKVAIAVTDPQGLAAARSHATQFELQAAFSFNGIIAGFLDQTYIGQPVEPSAVS